ncbi:MFS transporter [Microlunatus spumicola]|uniref:MFS transporter n=1 Tax=Microlunatus spumicola TaxID=81499 RepID=A0ABP6WHX4_9ACTN
MTTPTPTTTTDPAYASARPALAALLASVLSYSLLQTMVVPALPDLRRDLGGSASTLSWVLSAFLLTSAASTVVVSRLGDLYGRRRLLLVSLGVLGLGTLLAALAGSIGVLVAARAVQGLGAATFPLAFGVARDLFARDRVPVVVGTISAMSGVGFGVGLVLPGPLLDTLGWPWIFWSALAVVVAAFVAVALLVPREAARDGREGGGGEVRGRVDWAGAALFTVGLVALLLAVARVRDGLTGPLLGLVVVGLGAGAGFVRVERRVRDPLVDLDLLRRRPVLVGHLVSLLFGLGVYGAFSLVPQLVQTPPASGYGFGASATASGLFLLPLALTMLVSGPVAGRLGVRWGSRPTLVLACGVACAGFVVLALGLGSAWAVAAGAGVLGVGAGFAFPSVVNLVVDAVDVRDTGQATGVNTLLRTVGGAVGAQVAAAVLTAATVAGSALPARSGYVTAFLVSAVALAVAAGATLAAPRQRRRTEEAAPGLVP